MNIVKQFARGVLPPGVKRRIRGLSRRARLAPLICPGLPPSACIDVGASYYPHGKWRLLLESANTQWVAVEPNVANVGYVKQWPWPCSVQVVGTGLSETGGPQTLYVTNVDSGSSLLEPHVPPSMQHRFTNLSYFFPVATRTIDTITLTDVLRSVDAGKPTFVKLDTQGTELSILAGADAALRTHQILGVELEATLLATPLMRGSGRFWEACRYMEELGYELLDLKLIRGPSRLGRNPPRGKTYLNECDAVFGIRQDLLGEMPADRAAALCAFYLCNDLYEDALALLEPGMAACTYLESRGCDLRGLRAAVTALA